MTYADNYNIRNKSVVKMNDIANGFDGLLAASGYYADSTTYSTTSSTFADVTNFLLAVTVSAGESVFIWSSLNYSHSTAGNFIEVQLTRNTVAIGSVWGGYGVQNSTAGGVQEMNMVYVDTPGAGTWSYRFQWRTGAATAYTGRRRMLVAVLQTS